MVAVIFYILRRVTIDVIISLPEFSHAMALLSGSLFIGCHTNSVCFLKYLLRNFNTLGLHLSKLSAFFIHS